MAVKSPERKARSGEKGYIEALSEYGDKDNQFCTYRLAKEHGVSTATARRHTELFVEKGYLKVTVEQQGRKRKWYTLTPEGKAYVKKRLEQIEYDEAISEAIS